jgi:Zinc-binding dehydrogenase
MVFFYVEVTTARLNTISDLLTRGKLAPQIGSVLPLHQVRMAHEMLAGARTNVEKSCWKWRLHQHHRYCLPAPAAKC